MDSSDSPQQPGGGSKGDPASQKPPAVDVKPRLTKEQHDVLEQHFQQQHKPSTLVKKDFASKLGVPLDKINVGRPAPTAYALVLTSARTGFRTAEPRSSRIVRRSRTS